MEICALTMSYAELTPGTSCSSSMDSELDANNYSMKQLKTRNEFHRLVEELECGGDETEDNRQAYEGCYVMEDVEGDEEEDEDVGIKYPYERKDAFANLQERIEMRLKDSGDQELEHRAREIKLLLKAHEKQWKEEDKLEKEQSLLRYFDVGSIYTCVVCAKAFDDSTSLQKHCESAHDFSRSKFPCNLCGKSYRRKKNLDSHMKLHQAEFKCDHCHLVYQTEKSLEAHSFKYHQEEKDDGLNIWSVKCAHCSELFPSKTVKTHEWYCRNKERILAKKKAQKTQSVPPSPALSTVSYASFNSYQPGPSTLPMVSPIASYRDKSCQVCGETFASRQSMLRHVGRKHPEVKDDPRITAVRYVSIESPNHQYACTDCGKRLTTRAALTTHRARAHPTSQQRRHECPICHKSYLVPSEFRKHMQRVHDQSSNDSLSIVDSLPDIDDVF